MSSTLVNTQQVGRHLEDPAWVVVDCRFTLSDPAAGRAAWQSGHVPGARYADLEQDLSGPMRPDRGRHPLPDPVQLAARLRDWGIGGDGQVVIYDDAFGAVAARLWWLLRWLGHPKAALMDGGLQKWQREGRPLDTNRPAPGGGDFTGRPDDSMWISTAELETQLGDGSMLLLDARSEKRFRGDAEPFDAVAGHIPGARNRPYDDNLDVSSEFMATGELKSEYQGLLDGREPRRVVHMCGSGVTACHSVLAMEAAGLGGSRLYAGSWSEWITDPVRPVAVGE